MTSEVMRAENKEKERKESMLEKIEQCASISKIMITWSVYLNLTYFIIDFTHITEQHRSQKRDRKRTVRETK